MGSAENMMNYVEMRAESMMNSVMGKLKEKDMGSAENMMNYVVEKLKELLLMLENFGAYVLDKVDEVFPPETREEKLRHWLGVIAPYLIAGVALLMLFWCCRRCGCRGNGIVTMMKVPHRAGIGIVKMMKAPGRNFWMPRNAFESNPSSYFRNLRAKKI
ncbi:hypothetical protein L1049_012663 [Liquidambar formosana]|uniref:Uncharacterized protein n=1 Tax=Liquidambar formosana TaxID=63359 RepID=A0AAP0R354_LIQFO